MLKVCIVQLIDNGAYGHEGWRKKTEMHSLSLSLSFMHIKVDFPVSTIVLSMRCMLANSSPWMTQIPC
mgnify:CR=1 FL=1